MQEKNLKMVYFASSTLDLASLKQVNLAAFAYSLAFAVDRVCLELFIFQIQERKPRMLSTHLPLQ